MMQIPQRPQDELQAIFSKLRVPVLIIHGKEDRIVDIRDAEDMVKEWRNANPSREIRFVSLENVGHVPHEEFPRHLANEIALFIDGENEEIEDESQGKARPSMPPASQAAVAAAGVFSSDLSAGSPRIYPSILDEVKSPEISLKTIPRYDEQKS